MMRIEQTRVDTWKKITTRSLLQCKARHVCFEPATCRVSFFLCICDEGIIFRKFAATRYIRAFHRWTPA